MDDIVVDHSVRGAYNEHSRRCFHQGTSFRRCAIRTASMVSCRAADVDEPEGTGERSRTESSRSRMSGATSRRRGRVPPGVAV